MRILLLSLAVAAGAAHAECKLVRIQEWTVRLEHNLPVMDGEINGKKVGILIDTGAERSFVTRSAAARLMLSRYDASAKGMYPVPGDRPVEAVQIEELKIGGATRKNWNVGLASAQDFGSEVALVLGEDFLSATDVELDLPNRAIRLFDARDCQGVSLAYWAKGVAGQAALETGSGTMFAVAVNGQPLHAAFDTGSTVSALTVTEAARFGMTPKTPGVVAGGCSTGIGRKPVDYWSAPFDSFAIGDETIRNPTLRFGDILKSPPPFAVLPQMLLGTDFLRAHRVYVARSQKKLYFTYTGGTVFPADAAKGCQDVR
jgi:predicted aspartyl protease